MTPTTSSAESETLSARNRVVSRNSLLRLITSAPPPPAPPGRCTSSSTTSGASEATCSTAESTSAASPSTWIESSNDARSPDRKIEWSSTMSTLVIRSLQVQVHFGTDLCRSGPHGCRTTGAVHPSDDRFSHPQPVGWQGVEVDSVSPVAHEDVDSGCRTLDIDGNLTARVACRVEHRFTGGRDQRGVTQCGFADRDHFEPDGVLELDGRGNLPKFRHQVGAARSGAGEEPVPKLTLLGPCQPRHLARGAGAVLDESERLQHGVVQVRGDLRPLFLPHATGTLSHQLGPQPDHERSNHHAEIGRAS